MRKFGEYLLQHFSWQFFYVLYNYRHFDFENVYPRTLPCEFIIFCTIMVYLLLSIMFQVLRNSSPHPKWHILNLINIALIFHFPIIKMGPGRRIYDEEEFYLDFYPNSQAGKRGAEYIRGFLNKYPRRTPKALTPHQVANVSINLIEILSFK